jgi:hypothetical protein
MARPSTEASNAIIYLAYGAFLYSSWLCSPTTDAAIESNVVLTRHSIFGLFIAWKLRHQSKIEFLASNRTQKG